MPRDAAAVTWTVSVAAGAMALALALHAFMVMGALEPYMDEPFHITQAQAYCR